MLCYCSPFFVDGVLLACLSHMLYVMIVYYTPLSCLGTTGAWGMDFRFLLPLFSTTPLFFQNFHSHSFFKIFMIIRFSSFVNISRRHTSWIIRVFCVHSFSTDTVYDYENFEKKGGSREKRGDEIYAPCACARDDINVAASIWK